MSELDELNSVYEIRMYTGYDQKGFAEHFDLTIDSVQNWEQGRRKPPEYLIRMMKRLLAYEELFRRSKENGTNGTDEGRQL